MKKTLVIILSAVFILALGSQAIAFGKAGHDKGSPEMAGGPGMDDTGKALRFAEELGLNDSQLEKLENLKSKNKREKLELRHKIQLARLDIHDEMRKDKPGKSKINASIDVIADAQKEMMKMGAASMLEVKSILTKDQFKKLTRMFDRKKKDSKKKFFDRKKNKK